MNNKRLVIGFVLLIVVLTVWYLAVVPEFEKIPKDYQNTLDYKRTSNTNHEINGEWTGEKLIKGTNVESTIKIEGNTQIINGIYLAKGLNDEVLWEAKKEYGIDRLTREVISSYDQYTENSYFYFPPRLKKQTYTIWITQYLYPVELNFKNVETINGLEAYHFEAKNFIFDDTDGFEWLDLVPEVYKILADGTVNVWVEPTTGIILDYKGGGVAYYADKETGEKVQDMQTWSNEYTDDTITTQVIKAQNEKFKLLLIKTIIPIILAIAIIIITLFLSLRKDKEVKK
jgi:hypothetical protein